MKFKGKSQQIPVVPGAMLGIYQEGGEIMEDPSAAQDPMVEMMMMAEQAVSGQDCEMAMQVCMVLLQAAGGGQPAAPGAGTEPGMEGGAPVP